MRMDGVTLKKRLRYARICYYFSAPSAQGDCLNFFLWMLKNNAVIVKCRRQRRNNEQFVPVPNEN